MGQSVRIMTGLNRFSSYHASLKSHGDVRYGRKHLHFLTATLAEQTEENNGCVSFVSHNLLKIPANGVSEVQ